MSLLIDRFTSIVRVLVVIWLMIQYLTLKKCDAGILNLGKALPWSESLHKLSFVRKHGVKQFINRYHNAKDVRNDEPLWGDEVEYSILRLDHLSKCTSLSLRSHEVIEDLRLKELAAHGARTSEEGCDWHPEYGAWMIEGTPHKPYQGLSADLHRVESNMRLRRRRLLSVLLPNEIAPTMTSFPMLGVQGRCTTTPRTSPGSHISDSEYVSDDIISTHPRFTTLTANIRARREEKVDIRVPLFADVATPEFRDHKGGRFPPHVHMDAMAFGMGCCCVQLTFQGRDVDESRYTYDQLVVLSPILLALSAATPIHRGRLVDTDVRWDVISASVDDRTRVERGEVEGATAHRRSLPIPEMAGGGVIRQPKSRFGSASRFIYSHKAATTNEDSSSDDAAIQAGANKHNNKRMIEGEHFNDLDVPLDVDALKLMTSGNVDHTLATHVSHLFSRDPLVLFEGRIDEIDDEREIEHFENLQSTNWQTVRWKPPPPPGVGPNDHYIGWRTEFRALEIQLTDFENAAYTVFLFLVTRAILAFDLVLYVPITKVDCNMYRAGLRNAAQEQLFYFRKSVNPGSTNEYILMSAEQILMGMRKGEGCDDDFPGLIPLVRSYLQKVGADAATNRLVNRYLELIRKRATGELLTTASWIRKFVRCHPQYENDSIITDELAYDLVTTCEDIGVGRRECPDLLGYDEG